MAWWERGPARVLGRVVWSSVARQMDRLKQGPARRVRGSSAREPVAAVQQPGRRHRLAPALAASVSERLEPSVWELRGLRSEVQQRPEHHQMDRSMAAGSRAWEQPARSLLGCR
jgi:hypothetical protein